MSFSLIKYVWKAAIRDRLIIAMLVMIALAASVSIFLASSAINEKDQFAAVLSAGSIRVLGVFGLVVFTVFFIRRSLESKDIEFLLSRPISRVKFVLSYAVAFSGLASLIAVAATLCIYAISPHMAGIGYIAWGASIMLEYIITINVAFFFAMMLPSAAIAVMGVLGFYILSRMMGQILGIIDSGLGIGGLQGMEMIIQIISVITPRFDLLGQTTWLIYGVPDGINVALIVIQSAAFLCLILTAALIDLVKRQF